MHGPHRFWKLNCQGPWRPLTAAPLPAVAGPRRQLRQREHVSLSEATADALSCTAQQHKGTQHRSFAPVQPSKHSAAPSLGGAVRRSQLPCLLPCRSRPRSLSRGQICLSLSVSPGDVFCGFNFLWICCQEGKERKKKYAKMKSGQPRSRINKLQCKIVVFWGKVV